MDRNNIYAQKNSITSGKQYRKAPTDLITLYKIYENEFIDNCEQILLQKETDFLKLFYHRVSLILYDDYGPEVNDDYSFQKFKKECETQIYDNLYKPMSTLCQKAFDAYQKSTSKLKQKEFGYLTNFRAHCLFNQVPVHTCKGRFITVNDPNNPNKSLYIICTNCKFCYFDSSILMLCVNCKKEFYSSVISNIEKILPPATWEKYHCNVMYNAQMDCIKCHDKFWIKNSNLYCKNCKFMISPLDVTWNCVICHKDFQSNVKVYNALEFKLIKLAAKNALLYKRIVKPKEVPCKCYTELDNVVFTHRINCSGVLYYGTLSGKDTIFCSKCQTFCTVNKFSWFCPSCKNSFITKKIKIYQSDNEIENMIDSKGSSANNTNENRIGLYASQIMPQNPIRRDSKDSNPLYNSTMIDNTKPYMTGTNKSNAASNGRNLNKGLFDPLDIAGMKKRNFSINILNRNNSKINYKNQSINSNYDNIEDIEEIDDSLNGKLKIHVIKHPQKRNANLNKNIEQRNHNNIYSNVLSQRCNTITNDINKEKLGSFAFNRASTISNMEKDNNPTRGNFRNYQIFLPKRTYNGTERKYSNKEDFVENKDEQKDMNNSKGFNRFKLKYESPSSERKSMQGFNIEENEQREKIRENIKKNDLFLEENVQYHPEIRKISVNKKEEQRKTKEYENDLNRKNNIHSRLPTSPNKQIVFSPDSMQKARLMTQYVINNHNNSTKDQLKEFNFSDYQIITQLGQGTFGKIYLVEDKNNKIFSMKKIILNEELDLERIIKEYQLAHQLQHPNVIDILGFYTNKLDVTTFVIYILMEVGLTDWEKEIKSHVDKKKYYTEIELMNILIQLVSGLSFLQSQGVSHRDIKPQNVLIFKNKVYKIADFGEAKQITKMSQNRQINTLRGTELYMSPLLFNGLKTNQLDIKHNLFKSDVYSLGLCLIFAATLSVNSIYEIRKLIDMKSVRSYIQRILKEKYSMNFINLVSDMLELNERFRPDFIELKQRLKI